MFTLTFRLKLNLQNVVIFGSQLTLPTHSAVFLSQKIPAVTLGITHGENVYKDKATMEIEPMYKGIAQVIGVLKAIDGGVCDEQ